MVDVVTISKAYKRMKGGGGLKMPRSRERYYEWPLTVFLCSNLRGEIEGHIYIRVTFTCPSRVLAQNNVGLYCNRE